MIRRFTLLLLINMVLLPGRPATANEWGMRATVDHLAGPTLAGRGSGTPEGRAAAEYLAGRLEVAGLLPAFQGSYLQEFPLKGEGWTGESLEGKTGVNVAGILPGAGSLAQRYVVVGAHHDHLGRLDAALAGSGPAEAGSYYAGANDNASGVAVVLDLLERLPRQEPGNRRGILIIFFAGEEVGLQGSGHFIRVPAVPLAAIDAMVNFDTVGQMRERRLFVSGIGTTVAFPDLVRQANTAGLDLSLAQGGWSGSDHMVFNTAEVPVLFIFGGPYEQYNTPADLPETLDYAGMDLISAYAARLITALGAQPGDLPWVMVAQKLRPETGEGSNRETWFGSLPDFTEEIQGYKLAGVFDGSPAQEAGLITGDVLVRLGGRDVVDLATFTTALRAHDPGELVEVTVLREGHSLNFTVVLGNRKDRR
jgi:hypothetical protein